MFDHILLIAFICFLALICFAVSSCTTPDNYWHTVTPAVTKVLR